MKHESFFECVDEAAAWIEERTDIRPRVAVILSASLGSLTESIENPKNFISTDIPHFPTARAEGHKGSLSFGVLHGVPVVMKSGRFHHYEGHAPHEIVFPYFVLAKLGAEYLITTNAVGGINTKFRPGDLMLISDHINLMGINPLVGIAVQRPKDQFTSLVKAYDEGMRKVARVVAKKVGIKLKEGVYIATSGPSYETKAEIAAFRKLGADAVGMSTVPEVIAANFLGMKVLSLSCIANPAADLHEGEMTHAEVLDAMKELAPKAISLIDGVIEEIGKLS
jgi:purine-nucleoside phosphorylase